MRLIQTLVPEDRRDAVIRVLEEENVDYAMADETSHARYSDVVYVPAESEDVDRIIDRLRDAGVEREGYMLVSEAETIISDRFEGGSDDRADPRISRDELRTKAENLSRSTTNYVAFTILSAIVATAGLLMDSPAVVVGSMVIAPLIGPPMASCVGSVIGDDDLFWEGVRSQTFGVGLAIVAATLFAFAYRVTLGPTVELLLIGQVAERAHPGLLALAVALCAGAAGALSLTSGFDEALVGVMIAVALMPPIGAVGLGIAYLDPVLAIGAGVLVAVNLLSINAAGLVTMWLRRYRPTHWYDIRRARKVSAERLIAFSIAVLILSSFLAASSWDARQTAALEAEIEGIVDEAVDGTVHDVRFEYRTDVVSQTPTGVEIVVSDAERGVAAELRSIIAERTGTDIEVTVIYEDAERA